MLMYAIDNYISSPTYVYVPLVICVASWHMSLQTRTWGKMTCRKDSSNSRRFPSYNTWKFENEYCTIEYDTLQSQEYHTHNHNHTHTHTHTHTSQGAHTLHKQGKSITFCYALNTLLPLITVNYGIKNRTYNINRSKYNKVANGLND